MSMKSGRDSPHKRAAPRTSATTHARNQSNDATVPDVQKAHSRSERKRKREHNRRMEFAGSLENLCKILRKIDPTRMGGMVVTSSSEAKDGGPPLGVSLTRAELLNLAVETLDRIYNENEERKTTIAALKSEIEKHRTANLNPASAARPESVPSNDVARAAQSSQHCGQQNSLKPESSSLLQSQSLRHLDVSDTSAAMLPPDRPMSTMSFLNRQALGENLVSRRFAGQGMVGSQPGHFDQQASQSLLRAAGGADPVLSLALAQRRLDLQQAAGYGVAELPPLAPYASAAPPAIIRSSLEALIESNRAAAAQAPLTYQSPLLDPRLNSSADPGNPEERKQDISAVLRAPKRSQYAPGEER